MEDRILAEVRWGEEAHLDRERILFVCTGNIDRSRTAEDLYRHDPRYEVLSAGTASFAATPVTRELLLWADRVFVMCEREDQHHTLLRMRFPELSRPVVDLDVEDRWFRGDPELVRRLLKKLGPHLGPPQKASVDRR
jgi:protein-tyrosine phosphatase